MGQRASRQGRAVRLGGEATVARHGYGASAEAGMSGAGGMPAADPSAPGDPAPRRLPHDPAGNAATVPVQTPHLRHQRARRAAELCWCDGRWSEALLHYLEAETHLRLAETSPVRSRPRDAGL